MKPTFQTQRPSRHVESQRPQGNNVASPAIDWSFQPAVDLRGPLSPAPSRNGHSSVRGIYALTQGYFDAETKWEDRIEGGGVTVLIALAAWPIVQTIYTALHTL